MKSKVQSPPAGSKVPKEITSLEELEGLYREGFTCEFIHGGDRVATADGDMIRGGRVVRVKGRHLTPDETRQVKLLLEQALPPELPGEARADGQAGEPRYDFTNPAYRKTLEENKRKARALAVWLAYDFFKRGAVSAAGKLPETVEEITRFIEHRGVPDPALDVLYLRAVSSPVSVAAAANFS